MLHVRFLPNPKCFVLFLSERSSFANQSCTFDNFASRDSGVAQAGALDSSEFLSLCISETWFGKTKRYTAGFPLGLSPFSDVIMFDAPSVKCASWSHGGFIWWIPWCPGSIAWVIYGVGWFIAVFFRESRSIAHCNCCGIYPTLTPARYEHLRNPMGRILWGDPLFSGSVPESSTAESIVCHLRTER